MKILTLRSQDEIKFNELALLYGSIFYTTEWTKLFGDNITAYGIYNDNDELIGGFNLYKINKYGLSIYKDPAYAPTTGPFLKTTTQNPASLMTSWKETLSLIANFLDNLNYSVISISIDRNIIDMQHFIWNKFKVSPRYTYIIDLNQSIEQISINLSKKNRHCIKKALNEGLIAEKITDMSIVKGLVLKTFARQKTKINELSLDRLLFEFANSDNSYAFVTFNNSMPIATTFFVYDKYTTYAILGGYDHENKHYSANTISDWEGLKYAKNLGLKYFDFEGSMIPQVEKYMRGFGGQLTPYYRLSKAILPLEILLKFINRELF
jgi:lipid II:glycine glycyltransferase (peptidoglycan interpeptide bridge formation enzyme)